MHVNNPPPGQLASQNSSSSSALVQDTGKTSAQLVKDIRAQVTLWSQAQTAPDVALVCNEIENAVGEASGMLNFAKCSALTLETLPASIMKMLAQLGAVEPRLRITKLSFPQSLRSAPGWAKPLDGLESITARGFRGKKLDLRAWEHLKTVTLSAIQPDAPRHVYTRSAIQHIHCPINHHLLHHTSNKDGSETTTRQGPPTYRKNGNSANLNGKAQVPDAPGEVISCTELAFHVLTKWESQAAAKLNGTTSPMDYQELESVEGIANAVKRTYAQALATVLSWRDNHLVAHAQWGSFLSSRVSLLQNSGKSSEHMFVCSTSHAMALRLEVLPQCKVTFYNPALTANDNRQPAPRPQDVALFNLPELFTGNAYKTYFSNGFTEPDPYVFIAVSEGPAATSSPASDKPRSLSTVYAQLDRTVHGSAVYHMLTFNLDKEMRSLAASLGSAPSAPGSGAPVLSQAPFNVLAPKSAEGIAAMSVACSSGLAAAIDASADLLKAIHAIAPLTPAQVLEFLAARDVAGDPGLYYIFQNGHTDAMKAYCRLLHVARELPGIQLPPDRLAELVMAKTADGLPGMLKAHLNDRSGVMDAATGLAPCFKAMSPGQALEFLMAQYKEWAGARVTQASGRTATLTAFGRLVRDLHEVVAFTAEQLENLLQAKSSEGTPALSEASAQGHHGIVSALADTLLLLDKGGPAAPGALGPGHIFTVLQAANAQGKPAVLFAKDLATVNAFEAAVHTLQHKLLPEQVEALVQHIGVRREQLQQAASAVIQAHTLQQPGTPLPVLLGSCGADTS